MQPVIWRHFKLELPDDWEMLAFCKNPRSGRCTFADRYQHRLQFCWDVVPGAPDFNRMVSAYLAELKRSGQAEDILPATIDAWHGFTARVADPPAAAALQAQQAGGNGRHLSHFSRYFQDEQCLIQLVFPWPGARDLELEGAILRAVHPAPATGQGFRRWRAFGLDMRVSSDLALSRNVVQCANARFTFNPPHGETGREEHFERRGMVAEWLGAPVKDWLRRRADADIRILQTSSEKVGGHVIETISGDRRANGFGRLVGRRQSYRAAAWICPADGRLYFLAVIGGETKAGAGALAGRRLACCDTLRRIG